MGLIGGKRDERMFHDDLFVKYNKLSFLWGEAQLKAKNRKDERIERKRKEKERIEVTFFRHPVVISFMLKYLYANI